jgi:hypothetical protein
MAVTVTVDTVRTIEVIEEWDEIVSLIRSVHVEIPPGDRIVDTWAVVEQALLQNDVPQYGSSPVEYPTLVLVKRNAKLVPGTTNQVEIILEYGNRLSAGIDFTIQGTSSLSQVTTQLDVFGDPIVLQHTYPSIAGGEPDPTYASKTFEQGGTVQVLDSSTTLTATGVLGIADPPSFIGSWIRHVNSQYWYGGEIAEWLITNIDFKPVNVTDSFDPFYQFTFQFSWKFGGWDPDAVFTDARTGKPPPDLIPDVGYKTVISYPERDYNELFPYAYAAV